MKKVLALLMVAGMFSLVACGPTEEEKVAAEAEAAAMVEGMMGDLEVALEEEVVEEEMVLAVHECDATCEENGCTGARCGEEGHECSDACHASDDAVEGHEGHEHAEGEEHSEEHAH